MGYTIHDCEMCVRERDVVNVLCIFTEIKVIFIFFVDMCYPQITNRKISTNVILSNSNLVPMLMAWLFTLVLVESVFFNMVKLVSELKNNLQSIVNWGKEWQHDQIPSLFMSKYIQFKYIHLFSKYILCCCSYHTHHFCHNW